jgi:hypothetical protein
VGEDVVFELVDAVGDRIDNREVVVDDRVEQGIEQCADAV